jgi:hypothetical protein
MLSRKYEERGLVGIIEDYAYSLMLNDVELRYNICGMIAIEIRDSEGLSQLMVNLLRFIY